MKLARNVALFALALPALAMAAPSSAPQYAITDLGAIGSNLYSQAFGVSSNGSYVVGRSLMDDQIAVNPWPAFVWSAGSGMTAVSNLSGYDYSWGYGVNNSGVAVGVSALNETGTSAVPVVWKNGKATQMGMAGQSVGHAYGINDSGIAVGSVGSDVNETGAIYNTNTGKTTLISALSAEGSYMQTALAISNTGLVAGVGVDGSDLSVALVYDSNTAKMTQLQMPDYAGGTNSSLAFNISSDGKYVVGTSGNGSQPYIWSAATGALLATLPSISSGGGLESVNTQGWAVGNSGGVYSNPILYADGTTYLLSDLITNGSAWNFTTTTSASALGIADNGVIIGTAQYNGIEHAYMLTAVPEPATYALMLGGLLAIGAVARRRSAAAR